MNKKDEITVFDKEKLYEEKIAPLVNDIKLICNLENIPFFTTFCIKNNNKGTNYITEGILTGSREIKLKDDRIIKHTLIQNGFDAIQPRTSNDDFFDFANIDFNEEDEDD